MMLSEFIPEVRKQPFPCMHSENVNENRCKCDLILYQ